MMNLDQAIAQYEQFANVCEHHGLTASQEEFEQLAAWLRELKERRKADSCEGCANIGLWENEYEYGMNCPCLRCARRAKDNYAPERRTE